MKKRARAHIYELEESAELLSCAFENRAHDLVSPSQHFFGKICVRLPNKEIGTTVAVKSKCKCDRQFTDYLKCSNGFAKRLAQQPGK